MWCFEKKIPMKYFEKNAKFLFSNTRNLGEKNKKKEKN